ncbi:hypothetical protein GmHk_01G002879 [Glycine max]|nr:hypothetical protein GmHk_01G002879 [Glycine max]
MWQSLNKIIEKEENLLFKTKKLFSLLTQPKQKIQKLSLFLTLLFPSPPFSIETPTKLQPLVLISAPNRERRAFSGS